jgi:hypothetical protein
MRLPAAFRRLLVILVAHAFRLPSDAGGRDLRLEAFLLIEDVRNLVDVDTLIGRVRSVGDLLPDLGRIDDAAIDPDILRLRF